MADTRLDMRLINAVCPECGGKTITEIYSPDGLPYDWYTCSKCGVVRHIDERIESGKELRAIEDFYFSFHPNSDEERRLRKYFSRFTKKNILK